MFNNSILLINFNFYRDSINKEFLKSVYKPYFKSIIFYSDKPSNPFNGKSSDINVVVTKNGRFTHRIFLDFYQKYADLLSESDGLFYTHDDCIINTSILNNYCTSKIISHYLPNSFSRTELFNLTKAQQNWAHWYRSHGISAIQKIKNNPIHAYTRAFSDFFYLPKSYFTSNLINLFSLYKDVFLEIAIPTILQFIEPLENYQTIKSHILWEKDREKINNIEYLENVLIHEQNLIVHPVKFNRNPELKTHILKILK